MPQNIFDSEAFFEGYRALRATDNNYNVLLEQPAMAALLPDLKEKAVLDLGCGYGHNCMDFVRRGASRVVGVDLSEKMLAVAKAENSHEKIAYYNMDMTGLDALGQVFDLVYSSLAFHYVEHFAPFVIKINRHSPYLSITLHKCYPYYLFGISTFPNSAYHSIALRKFSIMIV